MRSTPLARWISLGLAAAGGVVTDLGFPGANLWPLAFVGVALLAVALRIDSARWNALVGLVWGLAFFLPHISWTADATDTVPWVALSTLEALFPLAFGVLWTWARRGTVIWRSPSLQVLGFGLVWTAVEEVRAVAPFGGFPWGRLAFSQSDSPLARLAWLGGTPLLSVVVAATGAALALAVVGAVRLRPAHLATGLVTVLAVTGVAFAIPLDSRAEDGALRAGIVQGDVDRRPGAVLEHQEWVLANHVAGIDALVQDAQASPVDVALLPENVTSLDLDHAPALAAMVDGAARRIGAPVLLGTVSYPPGGGRYNLAELWVPGAGVTQRYAKQRPAAFGEFMPLRSVLRVFSAQVDRVQTDMIAGVEPAVVVLDAGVLGRPVTLGTIICFEVAYDAIVRDSVRNGAEVLVVQTNNASFGMSDESTQQLAMSRLRAIETGRTTVQISTVGVSAVISPSGVLRWTTDLFTADQTIASLPLRTSLTPAVRFGGAVALSVCALGLVVVVAGAAGARRVRRPGRSETLGEMA